MSTSRHRPGRTAAVDAFVPPEVAVLSPFVAAGAFGPAEVHLAALVRRIAGCNDDVVLGVAAAAWASLHGHSCAEIPAVGQLIDESLRDGDSDDRDRIDSSDDVIASDVDSVAGLPWPEPAAWRSSLATASDVVRTATAHDAVPVPGLHPLVLCGDRLYLERDWIDEGIIAASLVGRAVADPLDLAPTAATLLDELLPSTMAVTDPSTGEQAAIENLQRSAAEVALRQRLTVIVGGPGTGKTYSVARLLAVLVEHGRATSAEPRIALAAPTGKAKARLKESIASALSSGRDSSGGALPSPLPDEVRASLAALVPTTIHRLLGPRGDSSQRFRHDASNPLPFDIVVIDETSMVDAPLLARLCEALRPETRLVLLGDPDQLESVERGAVLADIATVGLEPPAAGRATPLDGHVVRLLRGHRFAIDSPIAVLADAVRSGNGAVARSTAIAGSGATIADCAAATLDIDTAHVPSTCFVDAVEPLSPVAVSAVEQVVAPVLHRIRDAAEAGDIEGALRWSARARILCAHRLGPFGVAGWNALGERWVGDGASLPTWYAGRPLLITRNDLRLGLANGDTGVVVRRGDDLVAAFATSTGHIELDPSQLEAVETAYAMTIHKSQGSEYPTVVVVLPPLTSPLVGRELLYTAVTRTKSTLLLVGDPEVVAAAAERPAWRMTGLADAFRGAAVGQ